jgi:hypothetical protein
MTNGSALRNNSDRRVPYPFDPLTCMLFCMGLITEAKDVRPLPKPLNSEELHHMIADAEVVLIGTVTCATLSKTWQGPLETVTIDVTLRPDKILKGNKAGETVEINESYQQISTGAHESTSRRSSSRTESDTGRTVGSAPQVGRYRDGSRVLALLKPIPESAQYRPLGSGSPDAYLGLFQITPEGVKSDKYRFDEVLSVHAGSEASFTDFVISIIEE